MGPRLHRLEAVGREAYGRARSRPQSTAAGDRRPGGPDIACGADRGLRSIGRRLAAHAEVDPSNPYDLSRAGLTTPDYVCGSHRRSYAVAVDDWDGDGRPDLATVTSYGLSVWLNGNEPPPSFDCDHNGVPRRM